MSEQPQVEIPRSIAFQVERIAAQAPGIRYDAYDPHREAIEAAAHQHNLILMPSESIQPRTMEPCTPPSPAVGPDEAMDAVATVLHELLCEGQPHERVNSRDRRRASLLVSALAGRGWNLVRQP